MKRLRTISGGDGALGRAPAPAVDHQGPERLVGFGFRLWLNGFRTGDISNWEKAWSAYAGTIGADAARTAVGQLSRQEQSRLKQLAGTPGSAPANQPKPAPTSPQPQTPHP